jgi:IclR family acetate operon transcriptional repressor
MAYQVQSLQRGMQLLRLLAEGPQGLSELARATGLPKGTVFRLMASLAEDRYVVREPDGRRYMLGPAMAVLAQEVVSTYGWIGVVGGDVLRRLRDETGETVTVHVRAGAERYCAAEFPSLHPIRYAAAVGSADPIHIGAAGKVLLSAIPEPELSQLLATLRLEPITSRSITSIERLREEIDAVRRTGWAESVGERMEGSAAISVPIEVPGLFTAALSVLGPTTRLDERRRRELRPIVLAAAREFEELVGTRGAFEPAEEA